MLYTCVPDSDGGRLLGGAGEVGGLAGVEPGVPPRGGRDGQAGPLPGDHRLAGLLSALCLGSTLCYPCQCPEYMSD